MDPYQRLRAKGMRLINCRNLKECNEVRNRKIARRVAIILLAIGYLSVLVILYMENKDLRQQNYEYRRFGKLLPKDIK